MSVGLSRKILLVAYHLPPSTVAATFRPLRLAKYLPRLGHRVWIVTATAGSYGNRVDSRLAGDIPAGVSIVRLPNPNVLRFYEKKTGGKSSAVPICGDRISLDSGESVPLSDLRKRIRTFTAELMKFPEQEAAWAALSLLPALYIIKRYNIDLICSSGPPFSAHIIGLFLKRITGKPWIAQFGNPWTGNPSISWDNSIFQRGVERFEKAIVNSADSIVVIDEILVECMKLLGRTDKVYLQPNGYDPEHFACTDPPDGKFTVTYAGSFYNVHNPAIIYQALGIIEQEYPEVRADMRVVFAGPPASHEMSRSAPSDAVFTGPLGHAELIKMLNDSHLLIDFLTADSSEKFSVSCKLYEYMAARRPVLAITPDGPLAREMRRLDLGEVVPVDNPHVVAEALLRFYWENKSGRLRIPDSKGVERYSAPFLASEFMDIAEESCLRGGREIQPTSGFR